MNLPNKLTISRLILSILIIIVLLGSGFITSLFGIEMPKLFINEAIVIDLKYIIETNNDKTIKLLMILKDNNAIPIKHNTKEIIL